MIGNTHREGQVWDVLLQSDGCFSAITRQGRIAARSRSMQSHTRSMHLVQGSHGCQKVGGHFAGCQAGATSLKLTDFGMLRRAACLVYGRSFLVILLLQLGGGADRASFVCYSFVSYMLRDGWCLY